MKQHDFSLRPWQMWLLRACAWYTVLTALILIIDLVAGGADDTALQPLQCLLLFPLGLCLSGASIVRRTSSMPGYAHVLCHALLTIGGIFLCGFLPYILRQDRNPMVVPVCLLVSMVLWGIVFAVQSIRAHRREAKTRDTQPYRSQFGTHGR